MGRWTLPRASYVPKGAKLLDQDDTDAAIYTYEAKGKPCAIMFHGKANKPDQHYSYQSEERRQEAIEDYRESRREHARSKAAYRKARSKPHTLKVGDLLRCSWGYEQTNVDYFKVTATTRCTVDLVEIGAIAGDATGPFSDRCRPDPDHILENGRVLKRKRATADNAVKIYSWGAWAHPCSATQETHRSWGN